MTASVMKTVLRPRTAAATLLMFVKIYQHHQLLHQQQAPHPPRHRRSELQTPQADPHQDRPDVVLSEDQPPTQDVSSPSCSGAGCSPPAPPTRPGSGAGPGAAPRWTPGEDSYQVSPLSFKLLLNKLIKSYSIR